MDLVRKDGHLDRAYRVYISTFRRAHAVYYNIYYIRTTCSAIYYIRTARLAAVYYIYSAHLAIYYIRTICLVTAYYIYTACLAVYYIHTAHLIVYYIYTAHLAVYYNIYYIRATAAISLYLTSPIYS